MDIKNIIIVSLALLLVGIKLYQKYSKSKGGAGHKEEATVGKSGLSSQSDDYEPYSDAKK